MKAIVYSEHGGPEVLKYIEVPEPPISPYEVLVHVRACALKEEAPGKIINVATGEPFTYKDPCVQTDPHLGYNEAAATATRKAVKEFLRTRFKLG